MTEVESPYSEIINVLLVEDNAADARLIGALLINPLSGIRVNAYHSVQSSPGSIVPQTLRRDSAQSFLPDAYGMDLSCERTVLPRIPRLS